MRLVLRCFTGYSKRSTGCLNGCESGEAIIRRSSSRHRPRHAFTSKATPRLLEFWLAACQKKVKAIKIKSPLFLQRMKSKVVRIMLECGPSYPVSCRRSWGVRVYVQIALQRNTNGYWNIQNDKQRQQEVLKVEHSPWLLLRCWYQPLVCDTDPRCLCSSGPWSQWSAYFTLSTDWNLKGRLQRDVWSLTLYNVGERQSPLWQLLQLGSGVRWKCVRCVRCSAPPTLTLRSVCSREERLSVKLKYQNT